MSNPKTVAVTTTESSPMPRMEDLVNYLKALSDLLFSTSEREAPVSPKTIAFLSLLQDEILDELSECVDLAVHRGAR